MEELLSQLTAEWDCYVSLDSYWNQLSEIETVGPDLLGSLFCNEGHRLARSMICTADEERLGAVATSTALSVARRFRAFVDKRSSRIGPPNLHEGR